MCRPHRSDDNDLAGKADQWFPSVLAAITKGGLIAATRSLEIEYAGRGIRVNAESAGVLRTPMHGEETHADLALTHPLQRLGDVEDIVRTILFMEASPFMTGDILHVVGGWSAGG